MGLRGLWDVMVYLHTKVKSKEIDRMIQYFFVDKENMKNIGSLSLLSSRLKDPRLDVKRYHKKVRSIKVILNSLINFGIGAS